MYNLVLSNDISLINFTYIYIYIFKLTFIENFIQNNPNTSLAKGNKV